MHPPLYTELAMNSYENNSNRKIRRGSNRANFLNEKGYVLFVSDTSVTETYQEISWSTLEYRVDSTQRILQDSGSSSNIREDEKIFIY